MITEEERHIRRMKNPAYASGYHIGYANGYDKGEQDAIKAYDRAINKAYEQEITALKQTIESLLKERGK